ncbi:MAG: heme-binding protein [Pseudomonadota bacterium]
MAKIGWGRILTGVATVAAAGAAYVYLKQRRARAPIYESLISEGVFEIRRYPVLATIETVQYGTRDRALGNGFGLLAGYMFGEGRDGEEIAITMPVLASPVPDGGWRIAFLLPLGTGREGLDAPGDGIAFGEIPVRDVAVIAVPGKPTDRLFAAKAAELRRWIKGQARVAGAEIIHAYYNSPLEPGPALSSEIFLPLAPIG